MSGNKTLLPDLMVKPATEGEGVTTTDVGGACVGDELVEAMSIVSCDMPEGTSNGDANLMTVHTMGKSKTDGLSIDVTKSGVVSLQAVMGDLCDGVVEAVLPYSSFGDFVFFVVRRSWIEDGTCSCVGSR